MDELKQASKKILGQLIGLAEALSDEEFSDPLPVLLNNSIGKHFRHIIEFYLILLKGKQSGSINYDSRQHNVELEQNRLKSLKELTGIRKQFNEVFWPDPIQLNGSCSADSDGEFSVSTNVGRELVYNIEHTVHHMAIMRIAIMQEFPEIHLEEEFGYAYSTIKHIRQ